MFCRAMEPQIEVILLKPKPAPEPKQPLTVHILHHGLPLCGFHDGIPAEWPDGHQWVGLGSAWLKDANCEGCLEEHEK
jgi:hypothetical protein